MLRWYRGVGPSELGKGLIPHYVQSFSRLVLFLACDLRQRLNLLEHSIRLPYHFPQVLRDKQSHPLDWLTAHNCLLAHFRDSLLFVLLSLDQLLKLHADHLQLNLVSISLAPWFCLSNNPLLLHLKESDCHVKMLNEHHDVISEEVCHSLDCISAVFSKHSCEDSVGLSMVFRQHLCAVPKHVVWTTLFTLVLVELKRTGDPVCLFQAFLVSCGYHDHSHDFFQGFLYFEWLA